MPKYTTGEIAKLCGVTVRTVQYYDTRGILVPSELTEGGRRLYSEDDLKRLKIICFHSNSPNPFTFWSMLTDWLKSSVYAGLCMMPCLHFSKMQFLSLMNL